ncbi:hypothetical protein RHGRI_004004 [Rhododendron griersonianum]|uniref:GH16 domain-containing protein n=1 Tax=Rhododendron griersonianum TaxID=479676 RepID=A0AAV6L7A9_9ERIC|nr:hypothetical protein RHGRI_004004 [Rhododendron griersonianum]
MDSNIYIYGAGNKEQRFRLWFDPTLDFHTYTVTPSSRTVETSCLYSLSLSLSLSTSLKMHHSLGLFVIFSFYVDGIPIRQFNNLESRGVPYPKDQQMQIQCSLWEASDWATRGGHIKIDWSLAPFTASYRNFNVRASTWSRSSSCSNQPSSHKSWLTETLGR